MEDRGDKWRKWVINGGKGFVIGGKGFVIGGKGW